MLQLSGCQLSSPPQSPCNPLGYHFSCMIDQALLQLAWWPYRVSRPCIFCTPRAPEIVSFGSRWHWITRLEIAKRSHQNSAAITLHLLHKVVPVHKQCVRYEHLDGNIMKGVGVVSQVAPWEQWAQIWGISKNTTWILTGTWYWNDFFLEFLCLCCGMR